jgi:hypothetical protein
MLHSFFFGFFIRIVSFKHKIKTQLNNISSGNSMSKKNIQRNVHLYKQSIRFTNFNKVIYCVLLTYIF